MLQVHADGNWMLQVHADGNCSKNLMPSTCNFTSLAGLRAGCAEPQKTHSVQAKLLFCALTRVG
eukprot:1145352-Pelagomonas_calceolata.AAC.2